MFKAKNLFVVILILALIPLTASATITRVIGMGGEGANVVLKDAANPNIWPQLVKDYPNLAGGEFYAPAGSGWDFQSAYINYKPGEDCVLKIQLDQLQGKMFDAAPAFLDGVPGDYNRLMLTWGRQFSDFKLGVNLRYATKSYKDTEDPGTGKREASYTNFGLTLGATALENKLDLALAFDMPSFSDEISGAASKYENDGSMNLAFVGRYWYNVNENYDLIPNLKFQTMKDGYKFGDDTESMTTTMFALGLANNWYPVEDMLALFELGFRSYSEKYEDKTAGVSSDATDSETTIYWRLGFETKIFNWLDGRFGAIRDWHMASYESVNGKPDITSTYTDLYLGASTHWNRLNLDLLVQPGFLHNGPYFVTGNSTGGMFSQVSLKYDFNK